MLQAFPADDALTFDVEWNEWLFVLVVAFALTIAFGSAYFAWRSTGSARLAWSLSALAGLALLAIAVLGTVDAAPSSPIDLRLKTLLTRVIVALSFVVAGVVGAGLALLVLLPRRGKQSLVAAAVPVAVIAAALGFLIIYDDPDTLPSEGSEDSFHPPGTDDTSPRPEMVHLVGELDLPTGLAVGPDGEIVVVELYESEVQLFVPGSDGSYDLNATAPLGLAEGAQAFHVALHPEWPAEPYVYVSVEQIRGSERSLEVLRVRLNQGTADEEREPAITGLPISDPADGNHVGSGVTFCDGYFFISVGDQSHVFSGTEPEISSLAQAPLVANGKILRYRLDGLELVPDGVIGVEPPVYAMGFRNPFNLSCDRESGNPVVAENGEHGFDQVRIAASGSNHEWPLSDDRVRLNAPLYSSGTTSIAPTGAVIDRTALPAIAYVASFVTGAVYALELDNQDFALGGPRVVAYSEDGVYSLAAGTDRCLYVAGTQNIWRLEVEGCDR